MYRSAGIADEYAKVEAYIDWRWYRGTSGVSTVEAGCVSSVTISKR